MTAQEQYAEKWNWGLFSDAPQESKDKFKDFWFDFKKENDPETELSYIKAVEYMADFFELADSYTEDGGSDTEPRTHFFGLMAEHFGVEYSLIWDYYVRFGKETKWKMNHKEGE